MGGDGFDHMFEDSNDAAYRCQLWFGDMSDNRPDDDMPDNIPENMPNTMPWDAW